MSGTRGSGFLQGFAAGALSALIAGAALVYALDSLDLVAFTVLEVPAVQQALGWAYRNLGLSLVAFALCLLLYLHGLQLLRRRLRTQASAAEVSQAEHLVDLWTGLFFGIGVIWTAVGMRSALLYALGEPGTAAAQGAFSILQRLVDGGILIALSTTIFGGIGGYLMRLGKALAAGGRLRRYYSGLYQAREREIQSSLDAIERHLSQLNRAHRREAPDEPAPLARS
jgi:hypothetical protein